MKKIVFVDLDFTLLRSDRSISDFTLDVLKKCQQSGVMIGFSTSRGVTNIDFFVKKVNPDIVICNGGATVFYKNQLVYSPAFSVEKTNQMLNSIYLNFGEETEITIDTFDNLYWNRTYDKSENYAPDAIFHNMKNFPWPAVKICVKTVELEKLIDVANNLADCDVIRFSDIPWCKISNQLATKAKAIEFLSEYFSIPLEDFVAFGDDFSDIGMLKVCGTGVAMENAIPQVKEVADQITLSCDQDGVAVWLLKMLGESN